MPPDRLERSTTPPTHARPLMSATLGPQWLMESLIHRSTGKNLPTSMVNTSLLRRPRDTRKYGQPSETTSDFRSGTAFAEDARAAAGLGEPGAGQIETTRAWESRGRFTSGEIDRWRIRFSSDCRGKSRSNASSASSRTTSRTSTPPATRSDTRDVRGIPHARRRATTTSRATTPRLSFVQDRATIHDFGQGPVERTGNPLDVALDGNGFFVVQVNGDERYTRNGALQINTAGPARHQRRPSGARQQRTDHLPARRPGHLDRPRRHHHRARRQQHQRRCPARQAPPRQLRAAADAAEAGREPVRGAERRRREPPTSSPACARARSRNRTSAASSR